MPSPLQDQRKSKKIADILTKYFGNQLLKKVDRFEINTVDLGSGRTLRLDGIKKIKYWKLTTSGYWEKEKIVACLRLQSQTSSIPQLTNTNSFGFNISKVR